MSTLYIDNTANGLSGDRLVGALCHLGVAPSTLEWELSKLELGDFHMHFERQPGAEGIAFSIHAGATHQHGHDTKPCGCGGEHGHHHHHHHHEEQPSLAEVEAQLAASELSDFVKTHAAAIFRRIAEAAGQLHGQPAEAITLPQSERLNAVAQVVGICAGLEQLGVDKVVFAPLAVSQHAPLSREILKEASVIEDPNLAPDAVTPIGAAFAAEFGASTGEEPANGKTGIGIGYPAPLRVVLG